MSLAGNGASWLTSPRILGIVTLQGTILDWLDNWKGDAAGFWGGSIRAPAGGNGYRIQTAET